LLTFSAVSSTGSAMNLIFIYLTTGLYNDHLRFLTAFLIQDTNNFFLNRRFTFEKTGKNVFIEYIKFLMTTGFGGIIYVFLSVGLMNMFGLQDVVAGFFSMLVSGLFNFMIIKFWVFRKEHPRVKHDAIEVEKIQSTI
ncbi:MAG: GtrA family protein, partial [Candidatus Kariarchaeaceae archaeon]